MALTLYRAHTVNENNQSTCKDKKRPEDEGWQTCKCPIRAKGRLKGVRIRKACRTTTWSEAERLVKEAEERGYWVDLDVDQGANGQLGNEHTQDGQEPVRLTDEERTPIVQVIDSFIEFKQTPKARRPVAPTSVPHFYTLFGYPENMPPQKKQKPRTSPTLKVTCAKNNIMYAWQVTHAHLLRWIDEWPTGKGQTALRIGRVREFFAYCLARGYIKSDPSVGLEKPILTHKDHKQRLPFSDETVGRLLDCAIALPRSGNGVRVSNEEIEAIMLLMIHVGPGLADASALNEKALSEIRDHSGEDGQCEGEDCDCQGKDWTYWRIKNGVKVDTSIPASVVRKLLALPRYEGGFFFFNGWKGTKERTNCWQQILDLVFEMARVPKGESGTHRFRHTFAHRFLRSPDKKGGMYELSKAMGHRSVATTEKYYSAYVGEIAARVRSAVRSTWNRPKQVTA